MADVPPNVPKAPTSSPNAAPQPQKREQSASMSLVSNTLAVLGLIIIAVIVVWGLLHLANLSGLSLGSLLSPSPKIEITASPKPTSGQPVTISWKNSSGKAGTYAFLYQCEQNLTFYTPGRTAVMNVVPCGTSLAVGSSTAATMTPQISGTATTSVPISVVFAPADGSARIEGGMTLAVAPAAAAQQPSVTPSAPKPVVRPVASYRTGGAYSPVPHASSGPADLSVHIIAVGYIDPASGALLMNRAPQPGDTVGVEFDIANVGGTSSGGYMFQAHLPTAAGYTYNSPAQQSLAPGAHVVSTLRFTQLAQGGGIFAVIADPSGAVSDANRTNNEAAQTIY